MNRKTLKSKIAVISCFAVFGVFGIGVSAAEITEFAENKVPIEDLMETYDVETGEIATESLGDITLKDNVNEGYIGIGEVENQLEIGISPYSIIGQDNRVRVTKYTSAPYRYIGMIQYGPEDGAGNKGTGFLVGPSLVLTSARYVYDKHIGIYEEDIYFAPGSSASSDTYGRYKAKAIHVPSAYITSKKGDENYRKYDYALVELEFPVGNQTGYFGYRINAVEYPYSVNVNITGYGSDGDMYKDTGKATMQTNNYLMNYTIDTVDKTAGAPIYKSENGQFYAIGLHSGAASNYNFGRLITDRIASAIQKYNK